jgi:hypothetical protein
MRPASLAAASEREIREDVWCGLGIEVRQSVQIEKHIVRATTLVARRGGAVIWSLPESATRYFVDIEFAEGRVVAWDFSGVRYEIDPLTGEVLSSVWLK